MTIELTPSAYGKVVARLLAVVGDGPDADQNPDAVAITGRVHFTPSVPAVLVPSGEPVPFTAIPVRITAGIDSEGYLVYPEPGTNPETPSNRFVPLLASKDNPATNPRDWTYTVTFELQAGGAPVTYPQFSITIPADGTVDLTTVTPVPSSSGVYITQGEPGPAGKDGQSAYQMAWDLEGFRGTPEEYLASLRGKDGSTFNLKVGSIKEGPADAVIYGDSPDSMLIDFTFPPAGSGGGGGSAQAPVVQTFTADQQGIGMPYGAKRAKWTLIGGGGSGGTGARDVYGYRGGGGAGGGGGGYTEYEIDFDILAAQGVDLSGGMLFDVTVGKGGAAPADGQGWTQEQDQGDQGQPGGPTLVSTPALGIFAAAEGGSQGMGGRVNGQPPNAPMFGVGSDGGRGWFKGGTGGRGAEQNYPGPLEGQGPGPTPAAGGGGGGASGGQLVPGGGGGSSITSGNGGVAANLLALGGAGGAGGTGFDGQIITAGPHNNGQAGQGFGAGGGGGAGGGSNGMDPSQTAPAGLGGAGADGVARVVWYFA